MKKPLKIAVIDLVSNISTQALYARVMFPNLNGIMPQVVADWCDVNGNEVTYICYTGFENLFKEISAECDVVIISAFTQSAQLGYALSNLFKSRGAITVLGGPHARCYPQDAVKYFDYVLGFTNKEIISRVLEERFPRKNDGIYLSAEKQIDELPGVQARWKYIDLALKKAPWIKIVPMIGSLGCPYNCSFCIDSTIPYNQMDLDEIKDSLQFLLTKFKRPIVAWHDPNFGVQFDDFIGAIEECIPSNSIDFIAETSLSLLPEDRVKRLAKNGFKALLPGIESWYDLGNKSKSGKKIGIEKVEKASEQLNMIMKYIPYIQANFVLGLDSDSGDEPFELTKRFIDMTPGAFPGYSIMSAFGQAAPLNLELQKQGRVLGFPFHFLDNNSAVNVSLKNYSWIDFYDKVIDLTKYSVSMPAIRRRFLANKSSVPRWLNLIRAISTEGYGRIKAFCKIRSMLATDIQFRNYFEQETNEIPDYFINIIRKSLGPFWEWLPEGALYHDQNAYLNFSLQESES